MSSYIQKLYKSHFSQRLFDKLTKIFVHLDEYFLYKNEREKILAFCLPILLSVFVVFMWILPTIDEVYDEAMFALKEQEALAQEFSILTAHDKTNIQSSLQNAQKMLATLQEKSLNNEALAYMLKPFNPIYEDITNTKDNIANHIKRHSANLSFRAVGDSEALEDILEILEKTPFIFTQNLSINAPFASGLEMRFEAINFGEILHKIPIK